MSFSRQFRHKPRQLILEYYLHWTTTFEISFSGSSDTNHGSLLWNTIYGLDVRLNCCYKWRSMKWCAVKLYANLLSLPGCFRVISSLYRFANNMNAFIGLRPHEFAFFFFLTRVPLRFTICSVDSSFLWYSTCSSFL